MYDSRFPDPCSLAAGTEIIDVSQRIRRRLRRTISTLNPKLLEPSDLLDLSQMLFFSMRFPHSKQHSVAKVTCGVVRPKGAPAQVIPFLDCSKGFLYYHTPSHPAPLEGSLQLRITPDNVPSSFAAGQDLLLPSGFPWQVLLPQVMCGVEFSMIRDQLLLRGPCDKRTVHPVPQTLHQ